MDPTDSRRETELLFHYLVKKNLPVPDRIMTEFSKARSQFGLASPDRWILMIPLLTGFLDAGAALVMPAHSLRRKILIMTALIETTPDYADLFLPRRYGLGHLFMAAGIVLLAGVKASVGIPLFIFYRAFGRAETSK
jgi:hypothetical protein